MSAYFLAFVPIFVAVDAIGMLPIFMSLTRGMAAEEKRRLIIHSTFTALLVAVLFVFGGRLLFLWLGITISDFLVAGGVILFVLSIRDLLSDEKSSRVPGQTVGVVPLAVPLIAGPAVLTTSLILLNSYGIYPTLFAIVANILLCAGILNFSSRLSSLLGEAGSHTLSKIASLFLAAIAVMMIRRGLFG